MPAKVGDSIVANSLPGTVLQTVTVGQVQTDLVQLQSVVARWVNASQLSQPPAGTPGEACIVGAVPGTISQTSTGGPYPLYLVLLQQPQIGWVLDSAVNPPLPVASPVNPAARPAVRP
jgi:hypothetical protein